jgi:hypothetical protein
MRVALSPRTVTGSGAAFSTGFQHAIENVPALIAFDWTLLHAPSGGVATSDRGYAIYDPTPPYPWTAPSLLSSENSVTTVPLSDTHCLLVRPSPASSGLVVRELQADEVDRLNLRTLGWAETHVFARSQATLADLRVAARRRPADVLRPKPFCQVALLEPDPDDDALATENLRRGWPAQLRNDDGEPGDYIVIRWTNRTPELWKRADELTERRARKRAGLSTDEPFEGRITNLPLHPLDISK